MERQSFPARVTGTPSQIFDKSNGGQYCLQNCEITEGPLKGLVIGGTRTLKNADGRTKEPVEVGAEVVVYLTRVPSLEDPNKMKNFFEISTGASATDDEINSALEAALASQTQENLGSQSI